MKSVWKIAPRQKAGTMHPCPWPLEIPRRLIVASCPSGGCVLDPFCGIGTTGIAAVQSHRKFIGIEKEADYLHEAERTVVSEVRKQERVA